MRYFLIIFLVAFSISAFGADVYVAQTATGNGSGSDASDALSIATYNGSQTAGNTYHFLGTITTLLSVSADSETLYLTNANLSQPNGELIYSGNRKNITMIGGGTAMIQNTATGTGLTFSNSQTFIDFSGASNVVVSGVNFLNQYIHTNLADANPDIASSGGIYANGLNGTNSFGNNTFSNVGWCISLLAHPSMSIITNCSFQNYDHGIAFGGGTNAYVHGNVFGSATVWDTTADTYHHDPIHWYGTDVPGTVDIDGNTFNGDMGLTCTALMYMETAPSNCLIFNNLLTPKTGNVIADPLINSFGDYSFIANNTIAGTSVANAVAIGCGGSHTIVKNNITPTSTTFIYVPTGDGVPSFAYNMYGPYFAGGNNPWQIGATGYGSFAAWQGFVGANGDTYQTVSPINANGSLFIGSPAIAAGVNLSAFFTKDITGATRTFWSVGAYDNTNSIPPLPTTGYVFGHYN